MLRTRLDYLPRTGERTVLTRRLEGTLTVDPGPGLPKDAAAALRGVHRLVHVDGTIVDYVLDVVAATRADEALRLGASTRAALHLLQASQARALLEDRDYVIPDDVKRVAPDVLAHRLALTVDAELDEKTPFDVLARILETVPVPAVEAEAR
jgi:MoxR-like ATPase